VTADALRKEGYTVFTASGTAEGLDRLKESRPDLIIMDDGLQADSDEDAIRQIRRCSYLPILVLGRHREVVEALERGADAFLPRPPSLSELKARVRVLLRRSTSRNLRLSDSNGSVHGPGAAENPARRSGRR
jgi:DNA-binding response OmpR family regulator